MAVKKKKKFVPKRAKPSKRKEFDDSYHEFSGISVHDGQPVQIELDDEPTPVTIHDALKIEVIGLIRNEKVVHNLESTTLQRNDKVYFIINGGWYEVWEGIVGGNGRIYTFKQVAWHQIYTVEMLKKFGYVSPVPLVDGSSIAVSKTRGGAPGARNTRSNASGSTKLAGDLPTDEAELRSLLASSTDKSVKSRIRAQLRKVNPNWAKSK